MNTMTHTKDYNLAMAIIGGKVTKIDGYTTLASLGRETGVSFQDDGSMLVVLMRGGSRFTLCIKAGETVKVA